MKTANTLSKRELNKSDTSTYNLFLNNTPDLPTAYINTYVPTTLKTYVCTSTQLGMYLSSRFSWEGTIVCIPSSLRPKAAIGIYDCFLGCLRLGNLSSSITAISL